MQRWNSGAGKYQDLPGGTDSCANGYSCMIENADTSDTDIEGICKSNVCNGNNANANDDVGCTRVTFCHHTCSETNPWVRLTVDASAWNGTDAASCGHLQDPVDVECPSKATGPTDAWGTHREDYLLRWHGTMDQAVVTYGITDEKAYWAHWERACPYVRGTECCSWEDGSCCGDAPGPAPGPAPGTSLLVLATSEPTSGPTTSPTSGPTTSPTVGPTTSQAQHEFECDTDGVVAEPIIQLKNDECKESVAMTVLAHNSDTNGDLELIVNIEDQFVSNTGYQPQLVLFLAPPDTTLEEVTTSDNGWSYFEDKVVAYMKAKIFCCMDWTWFEAYTNQESTENVELISPTHNTLNMVKQQKATKPQMKKDGAMKIRRRADGYVSYWYSFDSGSTWQQIGTWVELPDQWKNSPLKVGYRVKREWKCNFDFTTSVTIVSSAPESLPTDDSTQFPPADCSAYEGIREGDGTNEVFGDAFQTEYTASTVTFGGPSGARLGGRNKYCSSGTGMDVCGDLDWEDDNGNRCGCLNDWCEANPGADPSQYVNSATGLTAQDACCACGGGAEMGSGTDQAIVMNEEATVGGDVCFTIRLKDRMYDENTGYQAGVVMFFAPSDVTISDLSMPGKNIDNAYTSADGLRSNLIAMVGEKVHKDLDYTWYDFHTLNTSDDATYYTATTSEHWRNGRSDEGYMKLCRHNGVVTAYKSTTGEGFQQIGNSIPIPERYRFSAMKYGYMVKHNYACDYGITVVSHLDSKERESLGPTMAPTQEPVSDYVGPNYKTSYFTSDTSWRTSDTVEYTSGAIAMSGTKEQSAVILSKTTFTGDIKYDVQLLDRDLGDCDDATNTATSVAGIWLFFVPADTYDEADISTLTDQMIIESSIAAVTDIPQFKAHINFGNVVQTGSDDDLWDPKHPLGFLRLERQDGVVRAYQSNGVTEEEKMNGVPTTWTSIGSPVELPEAYKNSEIRIGLSIRTTDGVEQYKTSMLPTVDGTEVGQRQRLLRGGSS